MLFLAHWRPQELFSGVAEWRVISVETQAISQGRCSNCGHPQAHRSSSAQCTRHARIPWSPAKGLRHSSHREAEAQYHYNVLEKQFRRYVNEASRRKGNTGEVLLQLLESRLDNVVRRAGFVRTIWAARQMVSHGHVLLNGRRADRPSIAVKPGDVITLKEGIHKVVRENMESLAGHIVADWIDLSPAELSANVTAPPTADQIPFEVNTNLIVEFYR